MSEVSFSAPSTLLEAAQAVAEDEALAVAGGTSIGLLLRQRLIEPTALVSLHRIPDLTDIRMTESGELELGAAVTLAALARSATVRETFPALAKAAGVVGNARVRSIATIGGAMAHADPRQDVPPVLTALNASVHTIDSGGSNRSIPVREFLRGLMDTALNEDELIASITIPVPAGAFSSYFRFTPGSVEDYPTVSVAVGWMRSPDNRVVGLDLALGSVGSTPIHVPGAELCNGAATPQDIHAFAQHAASLTDPVTDRLGSDRYKRHVVAVFAERMLNDALPRPAEVR